MTNNCLIEIRQNGPNLVLEVEAPPTLPPGVTVCNRARINLAPADMDRLRTGDAPDQLVQQITAQVSDWLLTPDLNLPLLLGMANVPPPSWRLVFSVRGLTDERLRFELTDIPVELVEPPTLGVPLALHQSVSSIVHLLPKVGNAPVAAGAGTWPLRVLIVRSNPQDLGNAVPPAAPIRDAILQLRPGPVVQVDILSSEEPNLAGRPTREQLVQQIVGPYDILVYLGHGNLRQTHADVQPLGVLQLETADGEAHEDIDAKRLSALLHQHPVPVVLLVGCLTAAQLPGVLGPKIPRWMLGSLGVAQALINSSSGVQFVVGMRYRVETDDAQRFLAAFFRRLLQGDQQGRDAGNLEAALREARTKLRVLGDQAISWAAPVAFRALGSEFTFAFLASPPPALELQIDPDHQKLRSELWAGLSEIKWSLRATLGIHARILNLLNMEEAREQARLRQNGAVLMPDRIEFDPNQLNPAPAETRVTVPVSLQGALPVQSLEGIVSVTGGTAKLERLDAAPPLDAAGYQLLAGAPRENGITFQIRQAAAGNGGLPQGALFTATLAISSETPGVYNIGLVVTTIQPPTAMCAGNNAVIVPPL